jgi:hypothetical protein
MVSLISALIFSLSSVYGILQISQFLIGVFGFRRELFFIRICDIFIFRIEESAG